MTIHRIPPTMCWSFQLYALTVSVLMISFLYHSCTLCPAEKLSRNTQQSKVEAPLDSGLHCCGDGHVHPCSPFVDPERDRWQKPQLLLDRFGPYEGKIIADIGAGYGYFALRLAQRGAHALPLTSTAPHSTAFKPFGSRFTHSTAT